MIERQEQQMIVVVDSNNCHQYAHLLEEMFLLRAHVFHHRLRWDVEVHDGKECDKFDDEHPLYLINTDDNARRVIGSLRLLPMSGPTLLKDCFSDTLPSSAELFSPNVWECTRFCIDDELLLRRQGENRPYSSMVMIAALGELALSSGIKTVVGNFDPVMLRLYRHVGCVVQLLGMTRRYGRPVYLGSFPVNDAIVADMKDKSERSRSNMPQLQPIMAA
jgi:N-acyl-L-homoserine lactone synthetase